MHDESQSTGVMKKLGELIKDVRVAMMLTFRTTGQVDAPAGLHVRPMYTQKLIPETFHGELYFFTDAVSAKVNELNSNSNIMLLYGAPSKDTYVVVSGTATCEHNPAKAAELWNIHAKGWWPEGPQSEALDVIRVQVREAEYWDGPSKLAYAAKLFRAVATGERIEPYGDHGRVG